jgi:hypothetical protein
VGTTFVTLIVVTSLTASSCSIVYAFSWEDPQGPRPILGESRRKFRSSTVAPGCVVRIGPPNAISQPQRSLIDGYTRRQQCPYQRSPYCGPSHCCPSLTQPSGPWFAHAPVSFTPDEITHFDAQRHSLGVSTPEPAQNAIRNPDHATPEPGRIGSTSAPRFARRGAYRAVSHASVRIACNLARLRWIIYGFSLSVGSLPQYQSRRRPPPVSNAVTKSSSSSTISPFASAPTIRRTPLVLRRAKRTPIFAPL